MTTTDTTTLADFLLARIAEDEARAEAAKSDPTDEWLSAAPNAIRMLAECAAKRRIVEWAAPALTNWPNAPEGFRYVSDDGLDLLKILALPHADHLDFRDEWRA